MVWRREVSLLQMVLRIPANLHSVKALHRVGATHGFESRIAQRALLVQLVQPLRAEGGPRSYGQRFLSERKPVRRIGEYVQLGRSAPSQQRLVQAVGVLDGDDC